MLTGLKPVKLAFLLALMAVLVGMVAAAAPALAACPGPNGDAYSSAVLADGPSAYYRLDEPSGTTMCDSSSAHNNGTYNASGISYNQPGALSASSDPAVYASGASGVIGTSGSNSGISGNHSFTLEGWFRMGATAQSQALVDVGTAGAGTAAGLAVWHSPNGYTTSVGHCLDHGSALVLDLYDGGAECWDTTAASVNVYDGRWHYLVVTYNAGSGTVSGYVDARSLGSKTASVPVGLNASPIRVGYWVDTHVNQPFLGSLDEAAVYSAALSAAQIVAHYRASGATVPSTSATQVTCNLDVASAIDTCGAQVGDTGSSHPTNPVGTVSFSIVPGSDTQGTFPAGTTCTLQPTAGSGDVSFCSVQFKPTGVNADFPHIRAAYSGDTLHAPSSADTALTRACSPLGPTSIANQVNGQFLPLESTPPSGPGFGDPRDPCNYAPMLPPGYEDPPSTNDPTVTPSPRDHGPGGQYIGCNSPDGVHYISLQVFRQGGQAPSCPPSHASDAFATAAAKKKQKGGTTIRFKLHGPALVTFWIAKVQRKHGKKHLVLLKGGDLYTIVSNAGTVKFKFAGWFHGHKLKPGKYLLIARPFLQGSVGYPRWMSFRIKH